MMLEQQLYNNDDIQMFDLHARIFLQSYSI